MSLSIAIIGLPNVGKSTLFNALLKQAQADVSNYPFCTIEPNVGIVEVPDEHLSLIADRLSLSKKIPAAIKFIDIAGLVKDAHKGEGLGNQFLAHIRECDAILEVVRYFKNQEIVDVVDPESDIETIKTELILKDLEILGKTLDKTSEDKKETLLKIKNSLEQEIPVFEVELIEKEKETIKEFQFLTQKPILYIANVSEDEISRQITINSKQFITICAKLEAELAELSKKEAEQYLSESGISESGIDRLIKKSYEILNLITFYTLIPPSTTLRTGQIQAWPILKNTKAPQAAGKIHTDFEKGFIKAEVINWQELINIGDWTKAHEQGKVRLEGKEYIVQDGDVILFKFQS